MDNLVICVVLLAICASCDEVGEWSSTGETKMLTYTNKTNQIEETQTPVSQRCKCDFSNCDCYVEYINWNNGSNLARLYFRIDPNIPKKIFYATVYNNDKGLSENFELKDGMTCHSFKTDIFDKYCLRTYGRASYSDFNRICLQIGVLIRRDSVVSSDIECIKAWPSGVMHMQPSAYENPSLSELNKHLYKLRYNSCSHVNPSLAVFILAALIGFEFF